MKNKFTIGIYGSSPDLIKSILLESNDINKEPYFLVPRKNLDFSFEVVDLEIIEGLNCLIYVIDIQKYIVTDYINNIETIIKKIFEFKNLNVIFLLDKYDEVDINTGFSNKYENKYEIIEDEIDNIRFKYGADIQRIYVGKYSAKDVLEGRKKYLNGGVDKKEYDRMMRVYGFLELKNTLNFIISISQKK